MKKLVDMIKRVGTVANITLGITVLAFAAVVLISIANGIFEGYTPIETLQYNIDGEELACLFARTYAIYMPITQIVTAVIRLVKKLFKR
jgi:hypothetical protein